MPEQTNNIEEQVENIILAGFAKQEQQEQNANTKDNPGQKNVLDVDLYRLHGGAVLLVPNDGTNPLDKNAVESTPTSRAAEGEEYTITHTPTVPLPSTGHEEGEAPETLPKAPAATQKRMSLSTLLLPLFLLVILAAAILTYVFVLPLTATATVTIIPKTESLHTQTTFTIAAHPNRTQVQGRALAPFRLTKSETVPATGHGHQNAVAATGVITFYNSDSNPLTIPAGVTFPTQNGATIVTDNAVTVQAAVLPEVGTAITPAHAVNAGSVGNIPTRTIYERCCGSVFVTATNTIPFSGGQDERDYSYIQTSDIQNAVTDLLQTLTPQATAALNKEVYAGESLVTPLCTPTTTSNADSGTEAASVTVSVTQTCTSVAYQTSSLDQVATSTLSHSANLLNYQQEGTTQVTVNGSTYQQHTATLNVSLSGTWVYHFSPYQLSHFKTVIAGESSARAYTLLAKTPGVEQVSIHVQRFDFRESLPTDTAHISMQFFYLVS